ncbi:sulfatase-like hydrolase/transferase [Puniceicoccus vermicola]|uniref:Sulfatase-like hydrolase/transferase n=1 Tax=Puniceicoccus vermicola TaxID=388746 RepID=A0A7X1E7I7_9BACT|nr:sulfatase-like hydrolase/transferase [Puniceicoccus vermicola]MBC2603787.1 sulfatase-like hydrolase/transferase [Puniceicoccus vermicola]
MAKPPPNLIWIFGDQHRAQALGFRGDPNLSTPNLDRLASQGLSFEKALTNSPLCCPARGSLLTGKYPQHAVQGHAEPLDPDTPTIAHAFKDNGYHTAWFGKWHVDGKDLSDAPTPEKIVPRQRRGGFDTWIGYENKNTNTLYDIWIHGHRDKEEIPQHRLPGFETDALSDHFIAHLEEMASRETQQPFFASLSVQPPHDPYTPARTMDER